VKDLSLHLLDIAQNSVSAGSKNVGIVLGTEEQDEMLLLAVKDDGCGMSAEFLANITDPFTTTRTTRKVGLGIPFLKQSAEAAGGKMTLTSEPGIGTTISVTFTIKHIDRIPVGDIGTTVSALMTSYPGIDWLFSIFSSKDKFALSTAEIKQTLEDVPIDSPEVAAWILMSASEAMNSVFGGVLDEIIEGS